MEGISDAGAFSNLSASTTVPVSAPACAGRSPSLWAPSSCLSSLGSEEGLGEGLDAPGRSV